MITKQINNNTLTITINNIPVDLTGAEILVEFRSNSEEMVSGTFPAQVIDKNKIRITNRKLRTIDHTYLYNLTTECAILD